MIFKFKVERRGAHVHAMLFVGKAKDRTFANAGRLVFHPEEWRLFKAAIMDGTLKRRLEMEVLILGEDGIGTESWKETGVGVLPFRNPKEVAASMEIVLSREPAGAKPLEEPSMVGLTVTDEGGPRIYHCPVCGWQRGSTQGREHWRICPECGGEGKAEEDRS